jgi:hypothetical protein
LVVAGGCGGSDATAPSLQPLRADIRPSVDQAESPHVEIAYEKWILAGGVMKGNTSNGPGTFAGQILSRVPFDNGVVVKLQARYVITDPSAAGRSFTAIIEGTSNLVRGSAVLNGVVTDGWRAGAPVHVVFDILTPCPVASAPAGTKTCYQGIIRVGPQE